MIRRAALVASILAVGGGTALATDSATDKQKHQYLYDQTMKNDGSAASQQAPAANSGPGVQGAPDTRTGPATRAPGGSADSGMNDGSASSGASSGEAGSTDNTTTPSQDSSGVQGPADTRTGPSTRSPGEGAQ